jgi:hypothetical protein
MQILGDPTVQQRKVVQPKKPQPKKVAPAPQTVSENGVSTPVAVLPATTVKKVVPPPAKAVGSQGYVNSLGAQQSSQGGQSGGNDYQSLLDSLYPTPPPVDAQAVQAPYLAEYNKELSLLNTGQQTENTFDSKLAGELEGLLSSNGIDPGFAKSLQAALQVEALRNSGNTYAFAQGKLNDNFFGANGIIPGALSAANDAYNKQLPSGADKLSVLNYLTGEQDKSASRSQNQQRINNQLAEWTAAHTGPGKTNTGTWRTIPTGDGTYHIINSKTGVSRPTGIPIKKNASGKTVSLQTKNVGGKVWIFNPKTGKFTNTGQPYGNPRAPGSGGPSLQTKNIGGKVWVFNPKTGKFTNTGKPWGSPKTKGAGSTPYDPAFPKLKQAGVMHLQSGIANAYRGINPKTGQPDAQHPAATYQQAIQEGVQAGYSRAAATRMANRFYVHPWQRTGGWKRGMPGPVGG